MKPLRLSALAAALVLAACTTATPTDPAAAGTRASFDDGPGMMGTGNGAGVGGGTATTSDAGGGTTTSTDTTTQRGGGMIGSGN